MSDDLSGDMLAPSWPNLVKKTVLQWPPSSGVVITLFGLDTEYIGGMTVFDT